MESPFDLVRAIATILILAVGAYAYSLALIGRRARTPSATDQRPLFFVLLIPCLNEARVIGTTLESLTALRGRCHIGVLDDASDDGTPGVANGFPAWKVTLVQRRGWDARVGKGAALNQGYRDVLRWRIDYLYGPESVILVVFDADSRVPSDFLERVTPYFSDPNVVGVQSAVRMYNADRNWLTYWQNLEFIVWTRIFSRAKDRLGSATLGGNGQCVRLSALMSLGAAPWRPSLTEDLDLSLRLILAGGRIRFCADTYVAQEAVSRVGQLIRQRARWIQGHLVTWQHLPAVLRSSARLRVRLDLAAFLLLPAGLVPLMLATVDGWRTLLAGLGAVSVETLLVWYLLAFASAPLTVWALIREGEVGRGRAIVRAHLFLAYSTFWIIAAGRAVWSILRGDRSWAKTSRNLESLAQNATERGVRPATRPRLGALGTGAAIAMVASSSLVLIAAATMGSTYGEVTGAGIQPLRMADVAGVTGRPPSTPDGDLLAPSPGPTETGASASPSPAVAVSSAPTEVPTPIPTQTPRPNPTPPGITVRFPELTRCSGQRNCYVYVVRTGDNFYSIVRYYRVDYDTVLRMNPGLRDPARIRPGDNIRIPTPRRP